MKFSLGFIGVDILQHNLQFLYIQQQTMIINSERSGYTKEREELLQLEAWRDHTNGYYIHRIQ